MLIQISFAVISKGSGCVAFSVVFILLNLLSFADLQVFAPHDLRPFWVDLWFLLRNEQLTASQNIKIAC